MRRYLKGIVVLLFAIYLGYSRYRISQLNRSKTRGQNVIQGSISVPADEFEFYNYNEQSENRYLEFKHIVRHDGPCGNLSIAPRKRPCTPLLHVHLYQREFFTVHQGQFGYQSGEEIHSCDVQTCPPVICMEPLTPHTFWMADNKEDLILTIRIEPTFENVGLSRKSFENIVGTQRDKLMSFWQALVFLDNIQTYPVALPLPVIRFLFRLGALIGHLLGYQTEYEAYTT